MGTRLCGDRDAGDLRQLLSVCFQRHGLQQHLDAILLAGAQELDRVGGVQVSQRLECFCRARCGLAIDLHLAGGLVGGNRLAQLSAVVQHQHGLTLLGAVAQQGRVVAGLEHGLNGFQHGGLAGAVRPGDLVEAFRGEFQLGDAEDVADANVCDLHINSLGRLRVYSAVPRPIN
ncbi:hypothetical protein D3C71_1464960 [compost metagenome]